MAEPIMTETVRRMARRLAFERSIGRAAEVMSSWMRAGLIEARTERDQARDQILVLQGQAGDMGKGTERLRAEVASEEFRTLRQAEIDRLQKLCATWESAALAGLLALGLDDETAGRVGERIRALAGVKL